MSKNNTNAMTVIAEENDEQRSERQRRESAQLRLAVEVMAAMVVSDLGKAWPLAASKARSILTALVTESLKTGTVKGKDQTALVKLDHLLSLDDDDINAIATTLMKVRDAFRLGCNSDATVEGGIKASVFAKMAAGSFLPDSSASSADSYKKEALKAMTTLGIVKQA